METNMEKRTSLGRMVVASLKTLFSFLGQLNKYSSKSGMNSNSVYYDRFYFSWVQPKLHAVFCHVGNTKADFHCDCDFFFFFFFTKALAPQSQLSQLKAISFLFLTRQTSINLKSFHPKHTAAVHYPGCHLRSLPYMACSFSFPGLPFCFYSHKTDLQNFLSPLSTAALPSYPRRVCNYQHNASPKPAIQKFVPSVNMASILLSPFICILCRQKHVLKLLSPTTFTYWSADSAEFMENRYTRAYRLVERSTAYSETVQIYCPPQNNAESLQNSYHILFYALSGSFSQQGDPGRTGRLRV